VAESQYREAGIQLDKLETHIQSLQPETKINWSFKGTLNYLRKKIDNGDIKDNLVSLVETIDENQVISKDARDRLVSLVKQNRVALRNKK
jgi:Asp-tRNA(Asn)/Glu-tRNA(Gln) amidotransferase B subunit